MAKQQDRRGKRKSGTATDRLADSADGRLAAGASLPDMEHVFVARRRVRRLDIRLALGSITEVDARAYVLGIFRDVAPSGPARALDARLDGAIAEFTARRMFAGNLGEVFIMPTGRHPVRADLVLFAGLGLFDRFSGDVQRIVAEHVIRTFVRTRVEEFATVLMGAGSGRDIAPSLENLVAGFLHGLRDADTEHRFRGLTICEMDRARFGEIRRELYRLSSTPLFEDIELTLDEATLESPAEAAVPARRVTAGPEPLYLIVRQDGRSGGRFTLQSSVLTAGPKATVITESKPVAARELDTHLESIASSEFTLRSMDSFGDRLAALVLPDRVSEILPALRDHHLVVVHDAGASRVPWEAIRIGGWNPALEAGLSRRYLAADLSVAKWLEERRRAPALNLLLVVNPTRDLPGAEAEGDRLRQLFGEVPGVTIRELRGPEATRDALRSEFQSGHYDVLHYAGHAFFEPADPPGGGLVCHGDEVLTGADLSRISNLPSLVFFNACEAGRLRRGRTRRSHASGIARGLEQSVGLAEAFLRGGVANYLGTYWPVADEPAGRFAESFYTSITSGEPIGRALLAGRAAIRKLRSADWADYIHYGSHDFLLKKV